MGAIKYAFLKSEARKNMTFDIDESISIHGNSGPYLQYAYARCMSLLSKSVDMDKIAGNIEGKSALQAEEETLLKLFIKFPEMVSEAADKYAPHVVCTYLFKLAQSFNTFYEKLPVLKAAPQEKMVRLQMTQATAILLKTGLNLLGIEVIEKI
jgi:arginyl-tRNA synthetase